MSKPSPAPFPHQQGIPKHTRCKNCGKCCGVIMANEEEIKLIQDYVENKMPKIYREKLRAQSTGPLDCQFRDKRNHCCAIYPVRPTICRLFGVVKGMQCEKGNSAELDGEVFLDRSKPPRMIPRMI